MTTSPQNTQASNALITGGVQGIGLAIVEKFLARNNRVFVFDCITPDDDRVKKLLTLGVTYLQVDIASVESIKKGFEELYTILDTESLDILVNNAGIARDTLALRMSEADWDLVLQVNLKGAFFCAQHALKCMIKQKKVGYIINMSSVVGLVGNPGQINYAASKAGLIAVTKTLAKEYASRNVLVNAIAPGFIQTQLTNKLPDRVKNQALDHIPLKRFGTVQDVANIVSFLTSGDADYLTGQVICVDGGMILI
jgi:3-oxoacyl-[acyl-carrier protein] reductase